MLSCNFLAVIINRRYIAWRWWSEIIVSSPIIWELGRWVANTDDYTVCATGENSIATDSFNGAEKVGITIQYITRRNSA